MESHTFLLHLVLILTVGRVMGELAAKLSIPSVIGELFAGILIGPSLLGVVEVTTPIKLLAEIGIILLLFEVGLETDIQKLIRAGKKSLAVACCGVLFPLILAWGLCAWYFNFSMITAIFVAGALTATSIGITLRVLRELKQSHTEEVQIILGAAVIDDIIGIILLSMIYEFSIEGSVNLLHSARILLFIALFFVIAPLAALLISKLLSQWYKRTSIPGLIPTATVSLILTFAWAAHVLGAPELLGGFAAGLALSKQFFLPFGMNINVSKAFVHRVEEEMKPIIHLFTPIFFVAIGLSLNLHEVSWDSSYIWLLTSLLTIVAVIGKLASGWTVWGMTTLQRWAIGISMVPRGEVGLIFADIGLGMAILDQQMYTSLVLVIALTTIAAPFALKLFYTHFAKVNT